MSSMPVSFDFLLIAVGDQKLAVHFLEQLGIRNPNLLRGLLECGKLARGSKKDDDPSEPTEATQKIRKWSKPLTHSSVNYM